MTARAAPQAVVATPEETLEHFLEAIESGDSRPLPGLLCRDVCFITQDATAIRGRDRVAALVAQLMAAGIDVRSLSSYTLRIADFALVSAQWRLGLNARAASLLQTTEASLALSLREGSWKLLLVAPWGWS